MSLYRVVKRKGWYYPQKFIGWYGCGWWSDLTRAVHGSGPESVCYPKLTTAIEHINDLHNKQPAETDLEVWRKEYK